MQELIVETVRTFSIGRDLLVISLEELKSVDSELANYIHALSYFISDRNQSVILLIQDERMWDAEIIMRSIAEATFKILFVCYATPEERTILLREYWYDLEEINRLRRSQRARSLVGQARLRSEVPESFIKGIQPLVLSRKEENELARKWKDRRTKLERKWALPNMLAELENYMVNEFGLAIMSSFLHYYGIGSQLIHASETALALLWDRNHRPDGEKQKLIMAHGCRMLSDTLAFLGIVLIAISHVNPGEKERLKPFTESYETLSNAFREHQESFWKTQE